MKHRRWLLGALVALVWATPATADNRFIIRSTLTLQGLQQACNVLPLLQNCSVVEALGDPLGQLFLITSPLDLQPLLNLLGGTLGIVNAEVDQVLSLVGVQNQSPTPLPAGLLSDRTLVPYGGTMVWNSYFNQPAAGIVGVATAQSQFGVSGIGIVADINTGVDPTHPALQGVLLPGYDFTRNQPGASELNDLNPSDFPVYPPPGCSSTACPSAAKVNQSTAAVLDQSTAAVLDGTQYAAFGHGTMVMGVIHLVAPKAQLLPLKAFRSDGTGFLSDILRAMYYGVQNNANVINMSFDLKTSSAELTTALGYANGKNVISAASAGNDGMQETVYPAALQSDAMGVASTTDADRRSSFSNYGNSIVWIAAPGEQIVSTYPFSTYAAGWGTSFSAPLVSGTGALLLNRQPGTNQLQAATAVAHAAPLVDSGMGHGRLDIVQALGSLQVGSGADFAVSATPPSRTIMAGQPASFTVTAAPVNQFNKTVTWSCAGAPPASVCSVSPSSVTLDGTNPANTTVTLTTTLRGIAPPVASPRFTPRTHPLGMLVLMLVVVLGWLVLAVMVWNLSQASRRRVELSLTAGLLAVSLCVYACGGYGTGPGPGPGAPTLSAVMLNPSSVNGGSSSTGTVALSASAPYGGAVVSLSSNTTVATVPSGVTVGAGTASATFTVTTSGVSTSTPVTITASYGGSTQTASLTVTPPAPSSTLTSITLNPSSVTGGSASTSTLILSAPAPSGAVVTLSSSNTGVATVPASVTVAAGATSAAFTVSTSAVTTSTVVTISASNAGATKTVPLTVTPPAPTGTPAGTYTLTITGSSGNVSHATTVTVTVN